MRGQNSLRSGDILNIVNRWVADQGSISNAAQRIGVSRQALSAQLNGDKPLSPSTLKAAGIRRVVEVTYYLDDDI